jgi:hypothetical protein
MRFLLLAGLTLVACSTDTFVSGDGGGGDASPDGIAQSDAISGGDAVVKPDAAQFDPSSLGDTLALWLDAADAKTGDAGDIVVAWPDHQNRYTTVIQPGAATSVCTLPGMHAGKSGTINNHAIVTFCSALLAVNDAPGLHLGSAPFFIEAVIAPAPAGSSVDVLFTKTAPGDNSSAPQNLTIVAPAPNGSLLGVLNPNSNASSTANLDSKYHYVGFVRTSTSMYMRIDGQAGSSSVVNASDDVSNPGIAMQIGGYLYDLGNVHFGFRGQLVELLVVTDAARLSDVENYFKKRYSL